MAKLILWYESASVRVSSRAHLNYAKLIQGYNFWNLASVYNDRFSLYNFFLSGTKILKLLSFTGQWITNLGKSANIENFTRMVCLKIGPKNWILSWFVFDHGVRLSRYTYGKATEVGIMYYWTSSILPVVNHTCNMTCPLPFQFLVVCQSVIAFVFPYTLSSPFIHI